MSAKRKATENELLRCSAIATIDKSRSLLKYQNTPRESALGRMARREQRVLPRAFS